MVHKKQDEVETIPSENKEAWELHSVSHKGPFTHSTGRESHLDYEVGNICPPR